MDTIISFAVEQTHDAAAQFARKVVASDTVLIQGEIGAGKTEFVRGMARELGVKCEVSSPTFAIINQYESGWGLVIHADLYRIRGEADLISSGLPEWFGKHLCIVEWPERLGSFMPASFWLVKMVMKPDESRLISVQRYVGVA